MIFEKSRLGEDLAENFLQNVVYFPVSDNNSEYLINRFSQKLSYQFSYEEESILKEVCDGHPYFIKVAASLIVKNKKNSLLTDEELMKLIRSSYEIRAVARRIIEVQTSGAQEILRRLINEKVEDLNSDEEKTLESLGLIKKGENNHYQPFCLVFKDAIKEKFALMKAENRVSGEFTMDSDSTVLWQGKTVEEKFTPQEYEVLKLLLKEPNKLRSRDEIGDILWGENSDDKYSDWAIDQLISKLRKKISQMGVKEKTLLTIRSKGYKIIN